MTSPLGHINLIVAERRKQYHQSSTRSWALIECVPGENGSTRSWGHDSDQVPIL